MTMMVIVVTPEMMMMMMIIMVMSVRESYTMMVEMTKAVTMSDTR